MVSVTPEKHKKKQAVYEYMSVSNAILEDDYPKSDKSIGQIPVGGGAGECADALYGAALGGAKPIKTLTESVGHRRGSQIAFHYELPHSEVSLR